MKRKRLTAAVCTLALALSIGAMAGCSQQVSTAEDVNANLAEDAPPLLSVSHEGRYDTLGVEGCYGCHGATEDGGTMLVSASALPDDHYVDSDPSTQTIDSVRRQCITCHVQVL